MALPFLPAEQIPGVFEVYERCTQQGDEKFKSLCRYIHTRWVDSTLWAPVSWTVYMRTFKTKNDTEGWHWALNKWKLLWLLPTRLLDPQGIALCDNTDCISVG